MTVRQKILPGSEEELDALFGPASAGSGGSGLVHQRKFEHERVPDWDTVTAIVHILMPMLVPIPLDEDDSAKLADLFVRCAIADRRSCSGSGRPIRDQRPR